MAIAEPPFTDEHEALRESVRRFVLAELRPHATEWEEARWFPDEVFASLAEHGFLGLKYPEELRRPGRRLPPRRGPGRGAGPLRLGRRGRRRRRAHQHRDAADRKFGTEEQKQRYLAPAIAGEKIGALAITEPDAGSDVAGLKSHARRVDGGWVVNGSKMFITNGVRAHFWVTAVKTTGEGGHHGLSFLIIDRQDGVSASKIEKLGWHASDTALIAFDDVFVPEENLLGARERGLLPDHGQLPVGAAAHGARRGRRDAGRLRQDGGLRQASAGRSARR